MAIRTAIQKAIVDLIEAGSFYKVTYSGKQPTETMTKVDPASIAINETGSGMSSSVRNTGGCDHAPVLTNWRFECVVDFNCEVSVDYFLLHEFRNLYFTSENLLVNIVSNGDYKVIHPPRQDSHDGTKLIIGLTVNTRR